MDNISEKYEQQLRLLMLVKCNPFRFHIWFLVNIYIRFHSHASNSHIHAKKQAYDPQLYIWENKIGKVVYSFKCLTQIENETQ